MATKRELKQRWYAPGLGQTRTKVLQWLGGHATVPDGIDEYRGRVDLRGFPLSASPVTFGDPKDASAGVRWHSLDLSHSDADGLRFFGARIEDCVFDDASMRDARFWGSTVKDCSFRRADLRSAGGLGTGWWEEAQNLWCSIDFTGARLSESTWTEAVLEECKFARNGKRLVFKNCTFIDCTFVGLLESLLIVADERYGPSEDLSMTADFGAAEFDDSSIFGYALDGVRLPGQTDLIVLSGYVGTMKAAAGWLEANFSGEPHVIAASVLRSWSAGQSRNPDCCFDVRRLGDEVGVAIRVALEKAKP